MLNPPYRDFTMALVARENVVIGGMCYQRILQGIEWRVTRYVGNIRDEVCFRA